MQLALKAFLLACSCASAVSTVVTLHKYDDASARCGQVVVDANDVKNAQADDPSLEVGDCAGAGYVLSQGRSFRFENGSSYIVDYSVASEGSNTVMHRVSSSSGRCGQIVINSNYVEVAIKQFPDLLSGSCGKSGYEVAGASTTFGAQGLEFPLTYYWKRGQAALLHAYSAVSGRCGEIVLNASQAGDAKRMDPTLEDGSCFSAGFAKDDGTGTKTMANETFQVRYFVKSAEMSVLRGRNANSGRCAHFNIASADVAAAKAANPFLEDGACEAVGYKISDGSGSQTQQGVNVNYNYFLPSVDTGALVHSYSDFSGQCGQVAINASIVADALARNPELQMGGCLANGFVHKNGVVAEQHSNLKFDVEFYTMTGRSVFIHQFDTPGRCGQSTIRSAYVQAAVANDPGVELGPCNVAGYTVYDGTGEQHFVDEIVDIIYFVADKTG